MNHLRRPLSSAQSALSATSTQTSIISRNISGRGRSRLFPQMGLTSSMGLGGVKLVSVGRAADTALHARMLEANSGASRANRRCSKASRRLRARSTIRS